MMASHLLWGHVADHRHIGIVLYDTFMDTAGSDGVYCCCGGALLFPCPRSCMAKQMSDY